MKSPVTKEIERALSTFDPAQYSGIKVNKFQPRKKFFELVVENGSTASGIVDCMACIPFFRDLKISYCCRYEPDFFEKRDKKTFCEKYHLRCETEKVQCPFQLKKASGVRDVFFAAIEVKISAADFRSKNGHNFCGNLNYYAMPYELYKGLSGEIPEDIGVITYHGHGLLRQTKQAKFLELGLEAQKWILVNMVQKRPVLIGRSELQRNRKEKEK